jgi:hypothetical protein
MAVRKRTLLHLKGQGLVAPEDDRSIELAVYDVLLPCRMFQIDHKVAVLGRTSLTTEFLLRLVKAVPGISQEDAAAFFGFDLVKPRSCSRRPRGRDSLSAATDGCG